MTHIDAEAEARDLHVIAVQRRTIAVLVVAQSVGAVGITIGIATASLLARELSGSEKQAGLAQTFQVLGTALTAWLLARIMARAGRRRGLVTGYLMGAGGAILAVIAGVIGSMPLLLVGALLLGATTAANAASRYAATDLATTETRARALSVVVWATTIGAVAGPNLTGPASRVALRVGLPELTGPFALGFFAMLGAAVIVGTWLRPDPLLTARRVASDAAESASRRAGLGHVGHTSPSSMTLRAAFAEQPILLAAFVALAAAHAAMVSVMVMTPLHMEHGGATLTVIGVVISIHVLGMFAFSPLVGWAVDRVGRAQIIGLGGLVLLASLVLSGGSPEGESWQITTGLFLLGLGWSFVTVAASTVIADHAPLAAKTQVQGASDIAMSLTAAVGGAIAGVIVGTYGFTQLTGFAGLLAVAVLASGVMTWRLSRR